MTDEEPNEWLDYFRSRMRSRSVEMAAPDNSNYKWSVMGSVHPGYNDCDLVLALFDLDHDSLLPLDPPAAKDLHRVLSAYLQWVEETNQYDFRD